MNKTTVLTTLILLVAALPSHGQQRNFSAGGLFSPKACGVSLVWSRGDGFSDLRLCADLHNVLGGKTPAPGIRAEWYNDYIIHRWNAPDGVTINLYAGPGALVGYVEDQEDGRGAVAAVCGNIGFLFHFPGRITISAGFSSNLGFHLTMTDTHHSRMSFYKAGMIGTAWPEVGIRYTF